MKKQIVSITMVATLLLMAGVSQGQDNSKLPAPSSGSAAQLNEREWKALEGFFTSSRNSNMTVEFKAGDGILLAKLQWNGAEIHLVPSSSLEFTSKEMENGEPIHLVFMRDSSGEVNRAQVNKEDLLNRDRSYKQVVKKIMPHTPEMLRPFQGLYQSKNDPTLFLQITEKDNYLWRKQYWNDAELSFAPVSENSYFAPVAPNFTMDFEKDEKGNVIGMVAFKNDHWVKKGAPQFTSAQMTAMSGIYVSKDDPDNSLRFVAKGNQLILTQLWDKKVIILDALADNYFYNTKESYPVAFLKDDKGNITRAVVLATNTFIRKGP